MGMAKAIRLYAMSDKRKPCCGLKYCVVVMVHT